MTQQRSSSRTALVALLIMCLGSVVVDAFVSPGVARLATQQPPGWTLTPRQPQHQNPRTGSITELNMFMGSDGGVLGIGTPELVRGLYRQDKCLSSILSQCTKKHTHTHKARKQLIFFAVALFLVPISFFQIFIVYNFVGGVFCIGPLGFVQTYQRSWKICSKCANLFGRSDLANWKQSRG